MYVCARVQSPCADREMNAMLRQQVELDAKLKAGGAGIIAAKAKNKVSLRTKDGGGIMKADQRARTLQGVSLSAEGSPYELMAQLAAALDKVWARAKDLFVEWDANGDGALSRKELHKALSVLGIAIGGQRSREVANALFDEIDTDGSGAIGVDELRQALKPGALVNRAAEDSDAPKPRKGWQPRMHTLIYPPTGAPAAARSLSERLQQSPSSPSLSQPRSPALSPANFRNPPDLKRLQEWHRQASIMARCQQKAGLPGSFSAALLQGATEAPPSADLVGRTSTHASITTEPFTAQAHPFFAPAILSPRPASSQDMRLRPTLTEFDDMRPRTAPERVGGAPAGSMRGMAPSQSVPTFHSKTLLHSSLSAMPSDASASMPDITADASSLNARALKRKVHAPRLKLGARKPTMTPPHRAAATLGMQLLAERAVQPWAAWPSDIPSDLDWFCSVATSAPLPRPSEKLLAT